MPLQIFARDPLVLSQIAGFEQVADFSMVSARIDSCGLKKEKLRSEEAVGTWNADRRVSQHKPSHPYSRTVLRSLSRSMRVVGSTIIDIAIDKTIEAIRQSVKLIPFLTSDKLRKAIEIA